jgi:hypothetical protein
MGQNPAMGSMPGQSMNARSLIGQQIDLYELMLKQPPVAAFLRQQALLVDLTLSVIKMQKRLRKQS